MKQGNKFLSIRSIPRVFSFFPLLVVFISILSFSPAHAEEFRVELSPSTVQQGDAFRIRVIGPQEITAPAAFLNEIPLRFSKCGKGCFIAIGTVDLDMAPGEYSIPLILGEDERMVQFTVMPGRFDIVHITVPQEKATPGPEEMERIRKEADLLDSIWGVYSERLWDGQFILPLPNPLSTPFGTQRIFNKTTVSIHRGLDIKGKEGEEIHASNHGRVALIEELFFGGKTIIVDHGTGIFTIYMHLSRFNVSPGDLVSKNDVIGFVGSTGRSTGPHLHFGVKVAGINTSPSSIAALDLD
jgi:hypothetical protein